MPIDVTKYRASPAPAPAGGASGLDKLSGLLQRDIQLFGKKFGDKRKETFYLELGILLQAGVDIKTAFELIVEEQEHKETRALLEDVKNQIIAGKTLGKALQAHPYFSPYELYSIEIGEESGKVTYVLSELAGYYQKRIKQKRQIISALTYPSLVMVTSLGAVFFMLHFVVPMFKDVFKRFGGKLPLLTEWIINLSGFAGQYFGWFLAGTFTLGAYLFSQRRQEWFRKASARVLLRLPLFGELVRKIYLARLCYALTLLTSSKIPITRSISLVSQMIDFYPVQMSLKQMEKDIMTGKPLHASMAQFPIYPKRMISLVKVGEEVNQLGDFFGKIARQYSDEIEHQSGLISSVIEPVMIIFLGLLVGVILVAMYLPLFQLSSFM